MKALQTASRRQNKNKIRRCGLLTIRESPEIVYPLEEIFIRRVMEEQQPEMEYISDEVKVTAEEIFFEGDYEEENEHMLGVSKELLELKSRAKKLSEDLKQLSSAAEDLRSNSNEHNEDFQEIMRRYSDFVVVNDETEEDEEESERTVAEMLQKFTGNDYIQSETDVEVQEIMSNKVNEEFQQEIEDCENEEDNTARNNFFNGHDNMVNNVIILINDCNQDPEMPSVERKQNKLQDGENPNEVKDESFEQNVEQENVKTNNSFEREFATEKIGESDQYKEPNIFSFEENRSKLIEVQVEDENDLEKDCENLKQTQDIISIETNEPVNDEESIQVKEGTLEKYDDIGDVQDEMKIQNKTFNGTDDRNTETNIETTPLQAFDTNSMFQNTQEDLMAETKEGEKDIDTASDLEVNTINDENAKEQIDYSETVEENRSEQEQGTEHEREAKDLDSSQENQGLYQNYPIADETQRREESKPKEATTNETLDVKDEENELKEIPATKQEEQDDDIWQDVKKSNTNCLQLPDTHDSDELSTETENDQKCNEENVEAIELIQNTMKMKHQKVEIPNEEIHEKNFNIHQELNQDQVKCDDTADEVIVSDVAEQKLETEQTVDKILEPKIQTSSTGMLNNSEDGKTKLNTNEISQQSKVVQKDEETKEQTKETVIETIKTIKTIEDSKTAVKATKADPNFKTEKTSGDGNAESKEEDSATESLKKKVEFADVKFNQQLRKNFGIQISSDESQHQSDDNSDKQLLGHGTTTNRKDETPQWESDDIPQPEENSQNQDTEESVGASEDGSDVAAMDQTSGGPTEKVQSQAELDKLEEEALAEAWETIRNFVPKRPFTPGSRFPDLGVDGEKMIRSRVGGPSAWHMPFRHKVFCNEPRHALARSDSSDEEESASTRAERDLAFSRQDPEMFAPTGDIYSYFVRRRVEPHSFSSPLRYEMAKSLGGVSRKYDII